MTEKAEGEMKMRWDRSEGKEEEEEGMVSEG